MDASRKPTADEVARFHEAVAGIEGVELRKMFGFPAAFIGGNLTASLHHESVTVRLPDAERDERIADGWSLFEPMPGRTMRQYVETPPEVAADVAAVRHWVERAAAYVRTLPPKRSKTPRHS